MKAVIEEISNFGDVMAATVNYVSAGVTLEQQQFNSSILSAPTFETMYADVVSQTIAYSTLKGYGITSADIVAEFVTKNPVQTDWTETTSTSLAFIKNKPTPTFSSYQALVSQSGASAPSAVVGRNDFGATTFTWARTSAGVYTITANASVFTSGKTVGIYSPLANLNGAVNIIRTSATVLTLTTAVQSLAVLGLVGFTATPTDAMLTSNLVEIRVYP